MRKNLIIEYHIERKRERSGKISAPVEFVFNNIMAAFIKNQNELNDVMIVPITLNYDKVYEG